MPRRVHSKLPGMSDQTEASDPMPATQRIRRFYKKVDVIEHPDQPDEGLVIGSDVPIDMTNLGKVREGKDKIYGITLDGRLLKTTFKDPLMIPSRPLAIALAEEWDRQLATIDMRTMHLNTMVAKAIRSRFDDEFYLSKYKKKEIIKILNNDQLCFIEPES